MELFDEPATRLLNRLHDELDSERRRLLDARRRNVDLDFLEPSEATEGDWRIAPVPPALEDRRVEITGPTNAKMVINALNSGAKCFMADFEDSNSPTWKNMTEGQENLAAAIRGTLTAPGKTLSDDPAVLLARVRGLHLPEKRLDACGAFMDFALYVRHNHEALADRGWGPFFYCPSSSRTSRRGCGTAPSRSPRTSSVLAAARSARPCSSRPCPPPSRWRRSSTSCASTPPASTPAAGTTSSR